MRSLRPETMAYKQTTPSEPFALTGWQLLEVAGADAGAYLQAQLMNDVGMLAPGYWQWNGWLTPKGRVIALFALIALDERRYWLVLPDFPAADLAARLRRFVLRSKVSIAVLNAHRISGQFAQPRHAAGSRIHRSIAIDAETVELDLGGDGGPRAVQISPDDEAAHALFPSSLQSEKANWSAFDLAHGLPRLPIEQSEAWTPQMLSLERLRAYSLKKGCYPGQEIVARTHYLGQAKRGLVRVAGNRLAVDAEIVADERVLGSIVSTVGDEALAVLSVDRPPDPWMCVGMACRELPLLDGLAR